MFLLASFIEQNLRKSLERIQSFDHASFLGQKWPIYPQKELFWKKTLIILMYFLGHYIVEIFKKILWANPKFWGQNGPFAQTEIFPEKLATHS